MERMRIVLVDDDATIVEEISAVLAIHDDMVVVAQGTNGEEAVQLCSEHQPDVILMDIVMPVMNGIEATRIITSHHPQAKIIALSGSDDTDTVKQMIAVGAAGYLLKDTPPDELAGTIRTIFGGKSVFSSSIIKPLVESSSPKERLASDFGLTDREMDVLRAMSEGLNNSEVAEKLYISTTTVRFHLKNIIEKLHADNRTEALVIAARVGLI